MSKNKNKAPKIPEIYQGLPPLTKETGSKCLVLDKHGSVFMFDLPQHNTIVPDGIRYKFNNFDHMVDDATNLPITSLIELHQELFNEGTNAKFNRTDIATYVWPRLLQKAQDRTKVAEAALIGKSTNAAGQIVRKSTIGDRIYTIVAKTPDIHIKTPQANTCYNIAWESADKETHTITEANLRTFIEQRAAEIKTKQDPWRIFQYYRPTLMQLGLIKHN